MKLPKAYSHFAQVSLAFEAAKAGLHKSTSTGLSFVMSTHLAYSLPTFKPHKRVILDDVIRHSVGSHQLLYSRWSPDRSATIEVVHEAVDQLQLEGLQGELPLVSGQWLVGQLPQDECVDHPNVKDTPKQVFPPSASRSPDIVV
jgi:hypothetical protein